ncbi:hypothetical protein J7J60_01745 [bacterium]|nr:hypothetical protein [bacterium]
MVEMSNQQPFQAKSNKNTLTRLFILLVVLLIVVILVLVFLVVKPLGSKEPVWQAVFLTNGQTYFGRVTKVNRNFLLLEDVHYLQTQEVPAQEEGAQPTQQLTLVKLGGEMHAPESKMLISLSQVLFVEDLRPDSQIVQAIKNQEQAQPTQSTPSVQPNQ